MLVHEYKHAVDYFKRHGLKSVLGHMQAVELHLHEFTSDRPVARGFFEKVLEYRRKEGDAIEAFPIPIIENGPAHAEKPADDSPGPKREEVLAAKRAEEKPAESEENPFEF